MKRRLVRWYALIALLFVTGSFLAPLSTAQEATPEALPVPAGETRIAEEHGLQIEDMNLAVDPGDDFYEFANGGWLDANEIPADSPTYGVFDELYDQVTAQLMDILGTIDPQPGTDAERVAQLYAQATSVDERAENGIEPLQPALDRINGIQTLDDALNYHQQAIFDGVSGLFYLYSGFGFEDASINVPGLAGPTLSLPSSDYYLSDSEDMAAVRQAWVDTTAELLQYIGYSEADATAAAEAVLALETAIAGAMTPEADRNDVQTYNNPRTIAELSELVPGLDWDAWIEAVGWSAGDADSILVDDIKYLDALTGILSDTSVDTLKAYFSTQLIWQAAPYLSEEIGATWFAFQGPVLSGQQERSPLDERGLTAVKSTFPDALGQLYVDRAFSPEAKAAIEDLVDNLIAAFRVRIENVTWMSDETKAKALEKLDAMGVKVGYPDKWETYEDIAVGDSFYETLNNASIASLKENYADIGQPFDREKWSMPVFEVNAYYDPSFNEIVFPAAILQAPFFDPAADPAANYGGIGFVIGHEITHGFDLSGSQFDAEGNVSSWWTDEDYAAFQALNQEVIDQYSDIEVLPDLNVDGEMTVTENVADLGGIHTAYDALQVALSDLTPEERAELPWFLTQDQRFFLAAATVWREEDQEAYLQLIVASDEHSPSEVRGVQPLRNMDEFYEAFGIDPGDPEYLPPDDRVVIW
jgi:putative endopeptidase